MKKKQIKYFTGEEKEKFLKAVKDFGTVRDMLIFEFLFLTGVRVSELVNLTVGQVKDKEIITYTGKGNKERIRKVTLPLAELIKGILNWKERNGEYTKDKSTLFCGIFTKIGLSRKDINYLVNKYVKLAGLDRHFTPHSFRHTLGFQLGAEGIPLQTIKEILGHESIQTTQIYVKASLDQQTKALEKIGC